MAFLFCLEVSLLSVHWCSSVVTNPNLALPYEVENQPTKLDRNSSCKHNLFPYLAGKHHGCIVKIAC